MLGFLVPVGGGDSIPLLKSNLIVGRRDECDITLRISNVSGRHCELYCKDGFWYVRDLQSSNGTKVNGIRIQEKYLPPGCEISFAKNKYKVEYTAPRGAAPPEYDTRYDQTAADVDPEAVYKSIFSRSLLERAGLVHNNQEDAPRFSREKDFEDAKRYDLDNNK